MVSEITLLATEENSSVAVDFVSRQLTEMDAESSARIAIITAVEEIFLNIAYYAYGDDTGEVSILMDADEDCAITLSFIDTGIAFDPLAKPDPDITMELRDRPIGGLGILIVKKTMDDAFYQRRDNQNIFTIKKTWQPHEPKETETHHMRKYHIIKSIKIEGDTVTVKLLGSLTIESADDFYDTIQEYLDDHDHLVIDMEQMPYITSAGIRGLFRASKKLAAHGGDVTALHVNPDVMGIFHLMNVDSIIDIVD